jgi:hypothetical protein
MGADADSSAAPESQMGAGEFASKDCACAADHDAESERQKTAMAAIRIRTVAGEKGLLIMCPWKKVPTSAPVNGVSGADSE